MYGMSVLWLRFGVRYHAINMSVRLAYAVKYVQNVDIEFLDHERL